MRRSVCFGAIGFFLGFIGYVLADIGGLRPDQFIAANWSWTGTQTFSPVLGTVVTETTTSRTLGASDCGKTIETTNGSAVTITLPSLSIGCHVAVVQMGAGQVTFSTSGTSLHNKSSFTKTSGQYAGVGVSVIESTVWILFGDGA